MNKIVIHIHIDSTCKLYLFTCWPWFQAWTALQVFTDHYCYTSTFQLPLYDGSPSPQMLKQLAREPCKDWMERNIRSGTVGVLLNLKSVKCDWVYNRIQTRLYFHCFISIHSSKSSKAVIIVFFLCRFIYWREVLCMSV